MNYIEIEWPCWHQTSVNLDEINDSCKRNMEEYHLSFEEALDNAIDSYVSGLDDVLCYSWNEDAQQQVKDAVLQTFGEQLSMFD